MSESTGTSSTRQASPPPRDSPLWRFGPPLVILVMLGLIVYAGLQANTGDPTDIAGRFPEVERVFPAPDSEVLRQSQVGVDLISGYGAELYINGTAIPPDQINVLGNPDFDDTDPEQFDQFEVINRYVFQPLGGRAIEELNGDINCVRAEVFPLDDPSSIRNVEWCFTAA